MRRTMLQAGTRATASGPRRARRLHLERVFVAVCLIGVPPDSAWSTTRVPDDRAAAVFYKSLGYDEDLIRTYPAIRVLVVSFGEQSLPRAVAVQTALADVAREARAANPASMKLTVERAPFDPSTFERTLRRRPPQVFYLVTEHDAGDSTLHELRELSVQGKIRVIIDDPELLAEFGTLSAAMEAEEDVPQLWIHLGRAKQQGCRFDAKFLRLCKVIGK